MDDQNINLNNNQANCTVSTEQLGYTTYHNICSGQTYTRQWGFGDWSAAIAIGITALVLVILVAGAVKLGVDAARNDWL